MSSCDDDYVPSDSDDDSDSDESDENLVSVDEILKNLPKGRCANLPVVSKVRGSDKNKKHSTDVTNSDELRPQGSKNAFHLEPVVPLRLGAQVDESNSLLPDQLANQTSSGNNNDESSMTPIMAN